MVRLNNRLKTVMHSFFQIYVRYFSFVVAFFLSKFNPAHCLFNFQDIQETCRSWRALADQRQHEAVVKRKYRVRNSSSSTNKDPHNVPSPLKAGDQTDVTLHRKTRRSSRERRLKIRVCYLSVGDNQKKRKTEENLCFICWLKSSK